MRFLLNGTLNFVEIIYYTFTDCYVEHMKKLIEKSCASPWSEYFTNKQLSTTQTKNCTKRVKLLNGTTDEDMDFFEGGFKSNWLLNDPDSPCRGTCPLSSLHSKLKRCLLYEILALCSFLGLKNDVEFEWEVANFQPHIWMLNSNTTFEGIHCVQFSYRNFEVQVDTVVRQVDIYQFVSFFGGGLGLFLGFAIYGTLLRIYKFGTKKSH